MRALKITILALAVFVCTESNAKCSWRNFNEGINAKKIILHDDTLWLNTLNGVYSINLSDNSIVKEEIHECADIHMDHEGRVYCVTAYGNVSRYALGFNEFTGGMTDNHTLDIGITVTDDGTMWLSHHNAGVFRFTDSGWKRDVYFTGSPCRDIKSYHNELWITSYFGVFAYKDSTWVHYKTDDGLPEESTEFLAISPSGTVWVSTEKNSIARFDGRVWTAITGSEIIQTYGILSLAADSNDDLWVGTNGGGILRYSGSSWESFTKDDGIGTDVVLSVSISPDGILAAATHDGGISFYDTGDWHTIMPGNGMASDKITALYVDDRSRLCVGTKKGLSIYDAGKWITFTEQTGLGGIDVTSIAQGAEGNLWVGSDGGFALCNDDVWITWKNETWRLGRCIAADIKTDSRGHTWIENSFSKIVYKYDGVDVSKITSVSNVRDIEIGRDGSVWFATFGSGVARWDGVSWIYFTENDGLSCNSINDIAVDSTGKVWFATENGGVSVFDGEKWARYSVLDGLPSDRIRSITADRNGSAWITTDMDGIAVFDGNTWSAYTADTGLPSSEVTGITFGHDGKVWIGTRKHGVGMFDGTLWVKQTIEDGLTSNSIRVILSDTRGNVYAGTYSDGLSVYTHDTAVDEYKGVNPTAIAITAAYPNPFNSLITVDYDVFDECFIELKVYNIHGQLVDILKNSSQSPGHYSVLWNAGERASGVYICVLRAGAHASRVKVLYVK